jgi:hypothetical protein
VRDQVPLECRCWCEAAVVIVTSRDLALGLTHTCGSAKCSALDEHHRARNAGEPTPIPRHEHADIIQ